MELRGKVYSNNLTLKLSMNFNVITKTVDKVLQFGNIQLRLPLCKYLQTNPLVTLLLWVWPNMGRILRYLWLDSSG